MNIPEKFQKYLKYLDLEETKNRFGCPTGQRSMVVVICNQCQSLSEITLKALRQSLLHKSHSNYFCIKCRAKNNWTEIRKQKQSVISKKLWNNSKFRNHQSETLKAFWKKPENKLMKQSIINRLWADESYRQKVSKAVVEKWKDQEYQKKQSLKSQKLWNDPNFIDRVTESNRVTWADEKLREYNRQQAFQLWANPEYRQRVIDSINRVSHLISESSKSLWNNPVYKEKMAKVRAEFLKSGKDSIIERISQQLLGTLDIKYERHYHLGPYEFDLFIPDHNLLVECQGEYWHSLETAKRNDASKFTYVDTYFPQLSILYLYENDFLNPGLVKQKLIKQLFKTEYEEKLCNFSFKNLLIKELSVKDKLVHSFYSAPEEFLQSFHYAGFGRSAKVIYGAYLDDQLIAVCKFAGVVRKEVATSMEIITSEVLELDRFCIHPQYQKKNFASWFITKCSKLVFESLNLKCLVSFADTTYGHSGIIYKAAGWKEIGKVKPSYHYINDQGWVIHKKTLYNHAVKMGKIESVYAKENGYFKVYGKEKIKFILSASDLKGLYE